MAVTAIDIGQIVVNATVFNFKNLQSSVVNESNLVNAVEQLFSILEQRQIKAVLVGGIALLQYVEGRNTDVKPLFVTLTKYVPAADLASLRKIVTGIQQRIRRFGQDFS